VKNAGHQVQTDQPEIVAEIVDQLLRRTSSAKA
jgi:pimeloyl-ACP methyl ester carboxylesterase